jgi:hypothetical protein
MKKLFTLGAMLIALATAGPAVADHGQSADHSVLTVQLGSGTVSPAASANAPANVDAPVCVARICGNQAGAQENGGASAGTNGGSGSGSSEPADQSADESIGTAQIGSATVDPAADVSAPVNANAPVCVLASCSSTSRGQQTGSASATTNDAGQSQSGNQSAHESTGTAQVGSTTVDPAAAVSAPVDANAPVCLLSACRSTAGAHSADGGTGSGGSGTGSAGGGGDAGGGGSETGGGGSTGGDTTGDEPGQLSPPQTGPRTAVGSTGAADKAPALSNATSPAGGRSGTAAAGAGVLGTGAGTSSSAGAETATVQPVIAKGHLPFSGLALARDLVLGLALMLVGLFTRALSASEGRRRL